MNLALAQPVPLQANNKKLFLSSNSDSCREKCLKDQMEDKQPCMNICYRSQTFGSQLPTIVSALIF